MIARTILVVDDEPGIVAIINDYLNRAGFRVLAEGDGAAALRLARTERPSLMLLDIMLPGRDGLEIVRSLRQDPATCTMPIIMLTARVDETDKLEGLELGADDYITKPFSPREVVARVKAVLRRSAAGVPHSGVLRMGPLAIDLDRRKVLRDGALMELTPTEFELLATLARQPGRIFTRAQLVDILYDHAFDGYDRTIDAHVKNLRRKIEPDPREPRFVLMVYGAGYRFAESATEMAGTATALETT